MFQIMGLNALCVLSLTFLMHAQIFADKNSHRKEFANDYVVYVAATHAMVLLATSHSPSTHSTVGYSLVGFVVISLALNIIVIYGSVLLQTKRKLKRRYSLFFWKAKLWDQKYASQAHCDCSCATCGGIKPRTSHLSMGANRKWINLDKKMKFKLKLVSMQHQLSLAAEAPKPTQKES